MNDKFDYVFRIKLKELLNESWKDGYSGYFDINNLSQSKLNCFIHYCLGGSESTLSVKEIMDIQNKDKMLLLLDGYDEVAHLNTRDEFKKLIDKILEYKNVIMTSRPNAVVEEMSNRFERKVENIGWDSEGIEQYVNKNFENDKELGAQLTSFLNTHSQIKEICKVPISTALICLVWSDKDIRDKFQKNSDEDFNISRLYNEIINWLNNRHLGKTQNKYKNKTEANNHLKNIMRFLEQIAYESLVATGKLVERKLVEDKKDTLDIDEVIEQGLLRREGQNFQFIHLTFQEYYAACYLENQLLDNHTKNEKSAFIGEHRNDPKYLMTMKFLAGIVNNDDDQKLIEIFWEAAICNVDGILELGIERKIILLMHLLTQSKINGKFDNRIPHLKQIQELIDDIVLKDITIWEQHIIDSGYLSEKIIKTVNEKLQNKEAVFQEFKTSAKIIAALANRNEWGSKTKIYEKLVNSLKIEDIELQELILQKLLLILDETIDEVLVKRSLKRILLLLNNLKIKEYVNIILAKIITVTPHLGKEILNQLQKKEFLVIIDILIKIVQAIPTQKAFVFLKNLPANLNYKIKHATACALFFLIKEIPIQEARIKLKELLANPIRESKYAAAVTLPEIIKEMPSLAPQIITFLKEEIINPNSEYNTKHIAIESITKIVKILPNLVQEIFDILKMVITNPYNEYNTKFEAVKSLADIVKVKPNLTQEVFNFLKSLIINSNNEYEIKAKAVENILEIIEVTPNLAQETFTFLKEIITNPKFNYDVKIIAIENIVGIVEVKPSLAQETFSFLKLVITNFNINYNAKLNAIESIATIVEVKPNLAQEAFTFLKVFYEF